MILLIFFTATFTALSQSIPQNLSNVSVNSLTDAQIRQLLQQAQGAGLSDNQIVTQAESRGLPEDQGQLLTDRIAAIRSKDGTSSIQNGPDTTMRSTRKLNYRPDGDTTSRQQGFDVYESLRPKVFGSELFRNKNMKFEPNLKLATPLNYIIGPEDQLYLNVYGKSVANWKVEVSPEGNINVPGVGIINVTGKTI